MIAEPLQLGGVWCSFDSEITIQVDPIVTDIGIGSQDEKMKKEYSPIRKLREELDLNQFEFGKLIGRAEISVRHYEKNITSVPEEVLERIRKVAAEKGFADIVLELARKDWGVRTVIYPPQEFAHKQGRGNDGKRDEELHRQLDVALASGDNNLILAIRALLAHFGGAAGGKKASAKKE